jgi:hypothetical protein
MRGTAIQPDLPVYRAGWILRLAFCCNCQHYECMSVQITIRNVSNEVRNELAARAARSGKSMQE